IRLELLEDLTPILLREIQVEQDHVRAGRIRVGTFAAKIREGLDAIRRNVEVVLHLSLAQSLAGQAHVTGVVLNQQNFNWPDGSSNAHRALLICNRGWRS